MLETVIQNWWGILTVLLIVLLLFFFVDRKIAKEMAWEFATEVEKNARLYGLEFVWQKKAWVKAWYPYLPPTVKLFVSQKLWDKLVETIYAQLPEVACRDGD